jgi:hypothetical protein
MDDREAQVADPLFLPGRNEEGTSCKGNCQQSSYIEEPYSGDPNQVPPGRGVFATSEREDHSENAYNGPTHEEQQ